MKNKIITALLIIFLFSINNNSAFAQKQSPNIVFIAIDDLNDYVNCMNGSIKAYSPNIDKLASQGVLFTNAHCQAPICGPSRASIMTGLYPSSSGNYLQLKDINIKKSNRVTQASTFMPDYFEQFGYKTMGVGKIYHNGDGAKTFDEYGGKFSWFGPKPPKRLHYDPAKIAGKTGNTQTDWGAFPENDSLMTDYKSAAWAISKLKKEYNQPFFLAVGFMRPHVPWHVPQKWFDMFPLDSIETPPYNPNDYNDIPEMGKRVANAPMMPTTEELIKRDEWKDVLQAYLACIAFVDAQVGKVLDALEKSKYADNTIVILWADHGYHLGEKNRFAKQALWERDTRTVFIIKGLNIPKSKKCNQPVQLIDIYPTLLNLCNLPENPHLEGHSLKKLIYGKEKAWNYPALSFYGVGNIAIRDKRYRLIRYEDDSMELYDMKNDPNEWHNLAGEIKYRKEIKRLRKYIPTNWSPLSKYSSYKFNKYFIEKTQNRTNGF